MPKTIVKFNGLLVFARTPKADYYEVGVLRARGLGHHDDNDDHILQISVEPSAGIDTTKFDPEVLESYIQDGNVRWSLEVEKKGQPVRGIDANANTPANRTDATQNPDDFGWVINIEEEFHNGAMLPRHAQRLQPVIKLTKGRLFTSRKTGKLNKAKGGGVEKLFGFIADTVGLEIDTNAGEEVVLSFMDQAGNKTEIFRLTGTDQQHYEVSIKNTPLPDSGAVGSHFHLFYDRLFTGVGHRERCDLTAVSSPTEEPDPFRCGGVRLGDGSGPLT